MPLYPQTYSYSITGSFPTQKVLPTQLSNEIDISNIAVDLSHIDVISDTCDITFKAALTTGSLGEEGILDSLVAAHVPAPVIITNPNNPFKQQDDGAIKVVVVGRQGDEAVMATHNFADSTTWFTESEQVVSGVLTQGDENGKIWRHAQSNWIDLSHGKYWGEDNLVTREQYTVQVWVDDELKVQISNFADVLSEGDYVVNYKKGEIRTRESWAGKTVKASFSYAQGSGWCIAPKAGDIIVIEDAEAQFSSDVEINDSIVFTVKGYAAVFAPDYVALGYLQPYDKVELKRESYKTFHQMIDDARGAYPHIPPVGGPRGMASQITGFPFRYSTTRELVGDAGIELWVSLENDLEFGGERVTATFYTTTK